MRNSKIDKIRMRVFKIWFLTLGVIVLVFAEKLSGIRDPVPSFAATLQSLQMMIGLVLPQIAVMAAFYLNIDRHKRQVESLSKEQITVITLMSVSYHLIFISAVILGIGFYRIDPGEGGKSLTSNAAAVVAIMGLFSVLLAPVAFLFSKNQQADSNQPEPSGSNRSNS